MNHTVEFLANMRGYAFVAFSRSYDRMCSYNWFAARLKYASVPNKHEFITDCLHLWDKLIHDEPKLTKERADELINRKILPVVQGTIYRDSVGRIGARRVKDENGEVVGRVYYPKAELLSATGHSTWVSRIWEIPERDEESVEWEMLWQDLCIEMSDGATAAEKGVIAAMAELQSVSPSEIGEYLGVSKQAVYNHIRNLKARVKRVYGDLNQYSGIQGNV